MIVWFLIQAKKKNWRRGKDTNPKKQSRSSKSRESDTGYESEGLIAGDLSDVDEDAVGTSNTGMFAKIVAEVNTKFYL